MKTMNEQIALEQIKHRGYYVLPKSHPESLGYPEILVVIGDGSAGGHRNPKSIHLRLQQGNGCRDWTTLRLKVFTRKTSRVCPGSVILRDWSDERVEFYTFGGSLETVTFPGETLCSLRSAAPILAFNRTPIDVSDQLVTEVKAIVDEHRVKWVLDDHSFVRQLSNLAPHQLYLATLHTMLSRFERYEALSPEYGDLYQALLREKEWFMSTEQWPIDPRSLKELLSPDNARIGRMIEEAGNGSGKRLQISHAYRR